MKIHLDQIGPAGRDLDLEIEASSIQKDGEGLELCQPIQFRGRVDRTARSVVLKGTLRTEAGLECARCLADFRRPVEEKFRAVFLLEAERPAEEEDLEASDLDQIHLTGEILDLAGALREQILLSLPLKPICREECAGLCPHCGADKNVHPCSCQPAGDPRLSRLKLLLEERKEEGS